MSVHPVICLKPKYNSPLWLMPLVLLLAACSTPAIKPDTGTAPPVAREVPAPPPAKEKPLPAAPVKRGGGYYLDDGPGDNPPPDIDAIPDAIPRTEAILPRASLPYVALGQRYVPLKTFQTYKQRGIASWYGRRYHGQKTSSGEIYDMYGMSAAHTILPIPSYVRVTNPENGKSVVVRVNDRGPFHSERLIDLSYAAAYKLRLIDKGSGLVEVETLDASQPPIASAATQAAEEPKALVDGVYIQVGAFKNQANADLLLQKVRALSFTDKVEVTSWYNGGVYRVRIGPCADRSAAERVSRQIEQSLKVSTYLITLPN